MLRVSNVSKWYGPDPVLLDVSFVLSPGERVGLVGPNGSGKSTLVRIAAGELEPDQGSVWTDPGSAVGYLPQSPLDDLHLSVRQALQRDAGQAGELRREMERLERAMASAAGEDLDSRLAEYARCQEEFARLDGYTFDARMEAVVAGLGLGISDLEAPVHALSGGNKTKLALARLLLSGADVRLLDEPTNYLDLPALLWLERFVAEGSRSYIIVSHDRRFLDRTVRSILELAPETHGLRQWTGNFSEYAAARRLEEQKRLEAYHLRQRRIERVEEDIRRTREQARSVERNTSSGLGADVQRRLAKKVARKAKARERRLERELENELVEKPKQGWGLHLADLGTTPVPDSRIVVEARGLEAGYGGRSVLQGVDLLMRGEDRVALLGENGSGKSTLVRCLEGTISFDGTLRFGPSIRTGVLTQEAAELPPQRTVLDVFRSGTQMHESDARTYLHKFLFSEDEPLKRVGELSYGQRAKLALAMLVLSGSNFLILDEPTGHLDMPALEAIEDALRAFQGPMLVVSHDRYFLEQIGVNRVLLLESGNVREISSVEQYECDLLTASARPALGQSRAGNP